MKRIATLLALLVVCAGPALAANDVRISQVYGGGGGGATTVTTWAQDYVEIYNNGNLTVDISNWTIEYGSATGNWGSSTGNIFTFPVGTSILPCQYMLVALGSPSLNAAVPPVPSPDFSNTTTNMSASTGKVALFNAVNSNLACGTEIAGTLVDKVSYGAGNCPEVTNVATLSNTSAAVRNAAGATDTDNNSADFTIVSNPVPRNSQSPRNPTCLITPTKTSTWGAVKAIYR